MGMTDSQKALVIDCRVAAKALAETNTFQTGQRILLDAANEIENLNAALSDVVVAAQWARNRLEKIADDSWHGDGRDLKRNLIGVFSDFDESLNAQGSYVPEHIQRPIPTAEDR